MVRVVSNRWSREELLVVLDLYCRIPFGRIHRSNPDIIQLAGRIGRTPSAVAMKMVNFASFDPEHRSRNISGLKNASKLDKQIWGEFDGNWESLALESRAVLGDMTRGNPESDELVLPEETEKNSTVKVRIVQSFFRDAVLSSYNFSCAICKLNLTSMLNASHIIPWSKDEKRRADPRNGLSLCVFHDRAFDRGLFGFDDRNRIIISDSVRSVRPTVLHEKGLLDIEGQEMSLPEKFLPDREAIKYHYENIFIQ